MEKQKHKEATKKLMVFILLVCAIAAFSRPSLSGSERQSVSGTGPAFGEGSKVLNVGLGFGNHYYAYRGYGYNVRRTPEFSLSYEQALKNKLGPGYLGLGAYMGFQAASYKNEDYYFHNQRYYYQHNYQYWHIAARGVYHADALIFEKGEIYFGAMLGLRYQSYKYTSDNPDPDALLYEVSSSDIYPTFSILAGGRWYFTPAAALFAELGYGISYLTLGVSFKF